MVDAMNAEVSLGTISTVSEAIEWLGYTYLFGALMMPPFPCFQLLSESVLHSENEAQSIQLRWVQEFRFVHLLIVSSRLSLRDPLLTGMAHDEAVEDPQLGSKRQGLTRTAGRRLAEIGMIRFDEVENSLTITDLGRIAAKYYLKHETVEIFSEYQQAGGFPM
jgi:antiviral helicase SLH1